MTFKLQIRTRGGKHVLNQLNPQSTLRELKLLSSEVTKIPAHAMKIFYGYPPKPLYSVSDSDTLISLSLRSGETLIVEEDQRIVVKEEATKSNAVDSPAASNKEESLERSTTPSSGILTKRIVPADNSCLFTSVDFVIKGGLKIDLESGKALRRLIAQIVASDRNLYDEAFLGKSNVDYCSWISDSKSWGGAIEISILVKHYKIEIDVIDTQTGRIDRFGEDKNYSQRVFLLYDGVHYDPIVLENFDGTSVVQTKFNIEDEGFLAQALEIGAEAKSSRQYTNINSGTMKCLVCNILVHGEVGLKQHLMETGHTSFSEV